MPSHAVTCRHMPRRCASPCRATAPVTTPSTAPITIPPPPDYFPVTTQLRSAYHPGTVPLPPLDGSRYDPVYPPLLPSPYDSVPSSFLPFRYNAGALRRARPRRVPPDGNCLWARARDRARAGAAGRALLRALACLDPMTSALSSRAPHICRASRYRERRVPTPGCPERRRARTGLTSRGRCAGGALRPR